MLRILFDNLVLLAVGLGGFTAGVFLSSQWLKDKIAGIPPQLRKSLNELQAGAVAKVQQAHDKAIADAVKQVVVVAPAPAPVAPIVDIPTQVGVPTPGPLA